MEPHSLSLSLAQQQQQQESVSLSLSLSLGRDSLAPGCAREKKSFGEIEKKKGHKKKYLSISQ